MGFTNLSHRLSTSPQIRAEEVAEIAAASFRSIICNRPDGEEQGQPTAEDIGAAARGAGLGFAHVPAVSGSITDQDGLAMKRALDELPGPVLAYCRSGARSKTLAEMAGALAPPIGRAPCRARLYQVV